MALKATVHGDFGGVPVEGKRKPVWAPGERARLGARVDREALSDRKLTRELGPSEYCAVSRARRKAATVAERDEQEIAELTRERLASVQRRVAREWADSMLGEGQYSPRRRKHWSVRGSRKGSGRGRTVTELSAAELAETFVGSGRSTKSTAPKPGYHQGWV